MANRIHNFTDIAQQKLALVTDRVFFNCLREQGPMTRAAISKKTGISRPTVSEAAQRLSNQALVIESQRETGKRQGRAGIVYKINAQKGRCLGVALNGESLLIRCIDLAKNVLCEHVVALDNLVTQDEFVAKLEKALLTVINKSSIPVLAIGVSIAAPINIKTGETISLSHSPFKLAENINFAEFFTSIICCPVIIDNDVNWATLAEKAEGNAVNESNFAFFYFGRGIGAGLYIGDRLLRGGNGMAGEVGYYPVNERENLQDFVNSQHLANALEQDVCVKNHPAIKSIVDVIYATSIIVNPDTVIVGGPLARYPHFIRSLIDASKDIPFIPNRFITSSMPQTAPLSGATNGAYDIALLSLGLKETI